MPETVQQYVERINSKVAGQDPIKVQASTAKKLSKLIQGKSAAKLRKCPAPGKWSASEILAHLADTEIVHDWRMRSVLAVPGTPIQAYDQDAWVVSGHYDQRHVRKSLEQFRVLREANLDLLKSLTPEQWKLHGMHAERGVQSIEQMVTLIAGHDINHLEQVAALLSQKK
jgi:DinB superfamily